MGLLPLPCSAPVERCAHFGANDVPNSKEGKTRRTSRNACDSLSHTRAVVACCNYGRLNSWEFQRSLFASAQLGCLEGSLFALRSASRVQMVIIWLRAARGSKDSIEDGSSWKTGAALVKPFHPAVPMVFRSSVHDQAMDQRHLAFAPSRGVAAGLPKMSKPRGKVRDLDSNLIARSARVRKVRTAARSGGDTVGRNRNPTNDRS